MADPIRKELAQRHASAMCARRLERQYPPSDRAGNSESSQRPPRRNRLVLAVEIAGCMRACTARRHEGAHPAWGLAHEPKAVAPDMIHVRIDDSDGGRHGHHRLDRIAAVGKYHAAGLDGGVMRRANHSLAVPCGMQIQTGQASAVMVLSSRPRRLSRPSALGSLPRNAR